ncbi:MAG TPA: MMPL family transporter [Thermomicrobiales bacterium]
MFVSIGRFAHRRRWPVIVAWFVVFAVSIPFLLRVEEPLKVGGFSSDKTDAARAADVLERDLGFSPSTVVVIFHSDGLVATNPKFGAEVRAALAGVSELPNVTHVVLPTDDPHLIARDGHTAYALVGLNLPPEEAQRDIPAFKAALRHPPDLSLLVAGGPAFYADIETVSQRDLRRAEVIAFPFALAALLLVFGSVVAAVVPLAVGGLGVATVLLALYGIAQVTDLSIFVLNLATMLGLGLAVDYSLFVTSRFREELSRRDGDVAAAVEVTVGTAGRAIFFSGLTVLIGLSGLTLFGFMFLRSVGIAGVVVVFCSVLAALTLLPAVLSVIGTRIDRFRLVRRAPQIEAGEGGFWSALSHRVMRHPVAVLVPTLALLLLLGAPFLHVDVSSPDATILPTDLPSRQAFDLIVREYGPGEISPFVVVVQSPTSIFAPNNVAALYDLTERLRQDPRIARVDGIAAFDGTVTREQAVALVQLRRRLGGLAVDSPLGQLANDNAAVIVAYSRSYANSSENKALLRDLRAESPGGDLTVLVGGGTADIVDTVRLMYGDFPRAIALIVVATYLVLLLLFRSVVLPLKAIVMNTLSIVASYGALVYVFQEGHFSGLLDFAPLGYVEASLPVIMFCVLFGLSMDYEVFLLSRVREEWDRTGDNTASVAAGLQRSGRIITSAALIVVVVTASFVSADVILIKALGLGIALAVALDATVVRALLVPATMRLLGSWNWWLPTPLRRLVPERALVE